MVPLFRKRALFSLSGFSLLEMLITMALIGIILALLTPKFTDIREEAYRQTARQQAKLFESALAQWYNAQPSVAAASAKWNTMGGAAGYANASSIVQAIVPYLNLKQAPTVSANSCYTDAMSKLPIGDGFIGNGVPDPNLTWSHLRFYWNPDRTGYAPQVDFFLPQIND